MSEITEYEDGSIRFETHDWAEWLEGIASARKKGSTVEVLTGEGAGTYVARISAAQSNPKPSEHPKAARGAKGKGKAAQKASEAVLTPPVPEPAPVPAPQGGGESPPEDDVL